MEGDFVLGWPDVPPAAVEPVSLEGGVRRIALSLPTTFVKKKVNAQRYGK